MSLRYGRNSADGAQPADDEQQPYPGEGNPAGASVTGSATDGTYADGTYADGEADVPTRPTFTAKPDAATSGSVPEPTSAPDDAVPGGAASYDTPSSYDTAPSYSAADARPTEPDLTPAATATVQDPPAQAQSAPSTVVSRSEPLLSNAASLRERWQQVQAEFVDDPRDAVSGAAELIEQTTQTLVEALQQRQRDLRTAFEGDKDGTATADGSTDTERLRLMMQRYRALFNQLTQV